MIQSKDLKFKYDEKLVLDGINIEIKEGEYICAIGANGSGKTTLALQLNGILLPTQGVIYVDNIDTANEEMIFEVRKNVGIVFQNPDNQIISSVVEEDIAFGPSNLKEEPEAIEKAVEDVLCDVELEGYNKYSTNELSGGQKQKVAIAGILAMRPKYLILDEATSMLDRKNSKQVLQIIKKLNEKYNITIIHITHEMEEVSLSKRVIVFKDGKIILDDTPEKVFKNIKLLKEVGLDIPIALELAYELKKAGFDILNETSILTCDDFVKNFMKKLEKQGEIM